MKAACPGCYGAQGGKPNKVLQKVLQKEWNGILEVSGQGEAGQAGMPPRLSHFELALMHREKRGLRHENELGKRYDLVPGGRIAAPHGREGPG
jgi:hypothetical protein